MWHLLSIGQLLMKCLVLQIESPVVWSSDRSQNWELGSNYWIRSVSSSCHQETELPCLLSVDWISLTTNFTVQTSLHLIGVSDN